MPAAKRLRPSKFSITTEMAESTAAKAPAAYTAAPTSSSPESTSPAMMALGRTMVSRP